jgi:hypothetical protein
MSLILCMSHVSNLVYESCLECIYKQALMLDPTDGAVYISKEIYNISKQTYYIPKQTYYISKQTYYISRETYHTSSIYKQTLMLDPTDGAVYICLIYICIT